MAGIDNRREKLNKRSPSETSYNFVRWRGPCLCPCSFLILVALLPSNDVKRRRRRGYGWILASASSARVLRAISCCSPGRTNPLPLLFHFFLFFVLSYIAFASCIEMLHYRKKKEKREKVGKEGEKKQRGRTKRCRDRGDAKRTKVASGGKLKGGRDVNENDNVEVEL